MKMARLALLGTIGAGLLAPGVDARGAQDDHAALHASIPDAGLVREVRRATRTWVDDPDAAEAAGYAPFLGCISGGEAGAMGLHYVNFGRVGDGKLDPSQPEALVYEKRKGRLRLPHGRFVDWNPVVSCDGFNQNPPPPPPGN
jgi:hypothetical protein